MKNLLLLCAAVPTCGVFISLAQSPPLLIVDVNTNFQVRLSWTNTATGFALEQVDHFPAADPWSPVVQAPELIGQQRAVVLSNTTGARFFRLATRPGGMPPDPAFVAPPTETGVATILADATAFLYTGTSPIQTGVTNGTLDTKRAAILRGMVKRRDNGPLSGVTISILDHPELGRTLSRADGMFDLAVNGGGLLTVKYEKTGFIPVQRQVNVPWQDYAVAEDVVMIQMDPMVTPVALGINSPLQVHQGSVQTDANGARKATVLIKPGTTAEMIMPDGSTQPITSMSLRATEFTVGTNGPQAMPAELPPTSAYTYCVELSADEAVAAGATDVRFNAPLPFYVENFLGFPVGTSVPLGSYDRTRGVWIAADSGKVIKILSVNTGLANLDVDGDGIADTGAALAVLSITDVEREQLAARYPIGQSLWRVLIPHFTTWDANWAMMPPLDAVPPEEDPRLWRPFDDCPTCSGNSAIEVPNQILGESIGVIGTPFSVHYQSERLPGRNEAYRLKIPLSKAQVPASLIRIELEISIAGQFFRHTFPSSPNQSTEFIWNGKNIYGQILQGKQPIKVRMGYTYKTVYGSTSRFGYGGTDAITASPSRTELTLWRTWRGELGAWDARAIGLGGWSLSEHHVYDPAQQILYLGDGGRQSARTIGATITTYAGTGALFGGIGDGGPATQAPVAPAGLAVGPDGSLYIAAPYQLLVHRVTPDGIIHTVAGNINACPGGVICGDGGFATNAPLGSPYSIAVGSDGSLYIGEAQAGRQRVRKVAPNGIISTFAGTGVNGYSGDGGPAKLAQISTAFSLAVGPDGSVYIADTVNRRVRRVTPDGIINTVAGTGVYGFSGDGGPATLAMLADPRGVAVGRDGSLYIADASAHRIRQVTPDGIIHTIAGTGVIGFDGEGVPTATASFKFPTAVAVDPEDTLYILDSQNLRVRWMRRGGTINTLAGNGFSSTTGDGGLSRQASLQDLDTGLAVGPDGSIYMSQTGTNLRVRRISPPTESFLAGAEGEILVPAADGSEVHVFTIRGRHLRTLDALTGALRFRFDYDAAGRLTTVTDGDDNATTIERNGDGRPTEIVGPYGQRTTLALNPDGFLEHITSPAGETVQLTCTPDGLLTSVTQPGGQTSSYAYDPLGRLIRATDPTGAAKTLTYSGTDDDFTVTMASALGRVTAYRVERQGNGDLRQTTTDCANGQSQVVIGADGRMTGTDPEGITRTLVVEPDPRWGMRAPFAASLITSNSGGLVQTTITKRKTTLAGPGQLLNLRSFTETMTINGQTWTNTYDGTNRTLVSSSPVGRRGSITLDDRGRPAQSQLGNLEPTAFTYDDRGRLATVAHGQGPGARVTTFIYGSDGFLARTTDPLGQTTYFTNDANGQVTAQTLPGGRVVGFAYDANGNLSGITPPGRAKHAFSYNLRNEVIAYTPPTVGTENNETRFAYDADRNSTRIDHPGGGAVQFQYEGGTCHLTLVDLVTRQRTYGYDDAGQLVSLGTSQGISLAYAYTGGILTNTTWSGAVTGSVAQTYDNDFRVTALRVNGADPITVLYDADNLPVQVGGLVLRRSPESGFITNTELGVLRDTMTYDGFGAPASYAASQNSNAVYGASYARDLLGRISQKTETLNSTTRVFDYAYDLAGRLSEVRQDGVLAASYTYDPNGNRSSRTDSGGTITATYDEQDRLIAYGSTTYSHNLRGERTSKVAGGQTTTYQYEGMGSLIGATLPDGTQIDYLLDALDRRVGKRINGTLVQAFLYQDELRPIAELNGAGAVVSRFVYATGRNIPDYMVKGGTTYRIITDQLGSPRMVINVATGQIIQQMDHDEFGRVTLDTNPGFQPFGFAGGLLDQQTGLVQFGAREYDPETGRWTTKDPIGFSGGDGNLYAYAGTDPVNNIDPGGLCYDTVTCTCVRAPKVCAAIGGAASQGGEALRRGAEVLNRGGQALVNGVKQAVSCPPITQAIQTVNRALASPNPIVNFFTGQSGPVENKFRIAVDAVMKLRPSLSYVDATIVVRTLAGAGPRGMRMLRDLIAGGQLASYLNRYYPP